MWRIHSDEFILQMPPRELPCNMRNEVCLWIALLSCWFHALYCAETCWIQIINALNCILSARLYLYLCWTGSRVEGYVRCVCYWRLSAFVRCVSGLCIQAQRNAAISKLITQHNLLIMPLSIWPCSRYRETHTNHSLSQ